MRPDQIAALIELLAADEKTEVTTDSAITRFRFNPIDGYVAITYVTPAGVAHSWGGYPPTPGGTA
jgi:hypothetical protein